ncbi:MAG: tRNA preQ1(34) S-adenosylmethionine ribosyltransferase-isomerase QueA [Spirochaetales bacterium]|nr:tRNA preQ1(34) S-adenosylmethionine ribosyltransferase-isomerase QueA [Spirochaetales bacterium]
MKTSDFFFDIDPERIAQYPKTIRGTSRLLLLDREKGTLKDDEFSRIGDIIRPGSLIVINDSRVRKARVFGSREETDNRCPEGPSKPVEFLFLEEIKPRFWKVLTQKTKKRKPGDTYRFSEEVTGTIRKHENGYCILELSTRVGEGFFERHGHVPLPPYIRRSDAASDSDRYQTVYSRTTGSAAAPTAGLHFTGAIMRRLEENGCLIRRITLHVGIGTFIPIRTETVEEHRMHEEVFDIPEETAQTIEAYMNGGKQIIAVGTTVVRALESACDNGRIRTGRQKTSLFIYPGYTFKAVNGLITNFHTPGSTLLVMVSAFAGKANIDRAYRHAIEAGYRFFSYGDAMMIV